MKIYHRSNGFVLPFLLITLMMIIIILLSIIHQVFIAGDQTKSELKYLQANAALHISDNKLIRFFDHSQGHCLIGLHSSEWFNEDKHWQNFEDCYLYSDKHKIQILLTFIAKQNCLLLSNKPVNLYEVISRDVTTNLIMTYIIAFPTKSSEKCVDTIKNLDSPVLIKYLW